MSGFLRSVAGLILCLVVLATAPAAEAAPGSGGGQGTGGSQSDGTIVAVVTYSTGGGGGGGDGCDWTMIDGDVGVPNIGVAEWPRTQDGVTYHLWERRCPTLTTYVELPETEPVDLLPGLLERLQTRELPSPEPVFTQLDPTHGWAYVTVPLDFRAGGNSWRTVSVTASFGPIWATVTAQPDRLAFDPGDPANGESTSCDGDAPVALYVASTPGACSYTYTNASSTSPYDGYHFMTSMTIDWSVSWTSSTGAGGPLEGYSTSSSAPLAVAEVQGIVTCTGARAEQGGC